MEGVAQPIGQVLVILFEFVGYFRLVVSSDARVHQIAHRSEMGVWG
jgi:hypothetical protein